MPLRLDVRRHLSARSDRVKSVDLHPNEPWLLVALYNGRVHIWNHETQSLYKSFEVSELPVRCAKFVPRKNWVLAGSDDMRVHVYNYNTMDCVHQFNAHSDYLRSLAVHPTLPCVLTSSDDMTIKLWDWDSKWQCKQVFEGHKHYVMQVVINPKDNNTFATASLDRTIKVWQFGSKKPNFTLTGHEKGVNCVDYYRGGDKPYLISGADDKMVKIWDYQNKTCVITLDGHVRNVSAVCFHPELPIVISASEDSTVRLWHATTYRLETTLNYGMERAWSIATQHGSNIVAIGYDDGAVVVKIGREEPAASMDVQGKILWARHSEIQQANLKTLTETDVVEDGERLPLSIKAMGACEIYPQMLQHSPNGRFCVVCGDGEYIIYTAMALRNKAYGNALEFVWSSADANMYATRESNSVVKVYKNFKECATLKADFSMEQIYGGALLGVRTATHLCLYDWNSLELIRRIEVECKNVYWNESDDTIAVVTDDSFFVLHYNAAVAASAAASEVTDDGIETAFDVVAERKESVKTALWAGACFVFTTLTNRLSYYVGGETITIAHLDRPLYLLGYIAKDSRLYAIDKDLNVCSYQLALSVLEYQTAVAHRDFDAADRILPTIPKEQRVRVAHFLEKQGFKKQALAVSTDNEHKFELALALGELTTAHELANEMDHEEKWKQLASAAMTCSEMQLAGECLERSKDYSGMLMMATASGNAEMMSRLCEEAEKSGANNVAFLAHLLRGDVDSCLRVLIETDRLPEAVLFARAYCPSQVEKVLTLWKPKVFEQCDPLVDPSE